MPPDAKRFIRDVEAFLTRRHGTILEFSHQGLDHDMAFVLSGHRFHLSHRGGRAGEGSQLVHVCDGQEIDVWQQLYGFKGDSDDLDAVMEYIKDSPVAGLKAWREFFPTLLAEYLETLA